MGHRLRREKEKEKDRNRARERNIVAANVTKTESSYHRQKPARITAILSFPGQRQFTVTFEPTVRYEDTIVPVLCGTSGPRKWHAERVNTSAVWPRAKLALPSTSSKTRLESQLSRKTQIQTIFQRTVKTEIKCLDQSIKISNWTPDQKQRLWAAS